MKTHSTLFCRIVMIITVYCFYLATSNQLNASTLCVSNSGDDTNSGIAGSPLRNIQTALDMASSGDTIKVMEGTYDEAIATKVSVIILGGYSDSFSDDDRDIFQNKTFISGVSSVMYTDYKGSTLDGFIFDCNSSVTGDALRVANNSVVSHNIVQGLLSNLGNSSIDIAGGATVTNNIFNGGWYAMSINSGTGTPNVRNNIITGTSFGLNTNGLSAAVRTYNNVYGNSFNYTGSNTSKGTGDISKNPLFKNPDENDYRILEISPCRDAGDPSDATGGELFPYDTRIDIGAYGGTKHSPYLPPVPGAPGLFSPINGTTQLSRFLLLEWNKSIDASSYHLQVATDSTFLSGIIVDTAVLTDTNYVVTDLSYNTVYYWRVNATVTLGTGQWSKVWNYTTMPVPIAPTRQASNIVVLEITKNSALVQWTKGNGTRSIVFMSEDTTGIPYPLDNTTYSDFPEFGSGSEVGSGWYCVYLGDDSIASIYDLASMTKYRIMVISLNGDEEDEKYFNDMENNNPLNFTTLCDDDFYGTGPAVHLYYIDPTKFDFEISLSHSCGSTKFTFYDVSLSNNSFAITTIGFPNSGSITGSLSADGNSYSGSYNISFSVLNQYGVPVSCGTRSGTWSAVAAVSKPSSLSNISGETDVFINTTQTYTVSGEPDVTYSWTATGGTVTGNGNSVGVTWNETGVQTLTVTPSNSCKTGTNRILNVTVNQAPNNIDELSDNSEYLIYPNPTNGFVTIKSDVPDSYLTVLSYDGKTLVRKLLHEKVNTIAVCNLKDGIYIIKIENSKNVVLQKLIKN
jgi:hypothetical protein